MMIRALSTQLFVEHKLTVEVLRTIEEAGLRLVEIFCAKQHFDHTDYTQVRELADWFVDHELRLHALHAPMYKEFAMGRSGEHPISIAEMEKIRRTEAVDEIKRALEVSERIPFRYLIQHMGAPHEEHDPRKMDAAFWSLEQLVLFARQRGVEILLENIPNELSTPMNLKQFIESTHIPSLGVCFDTGHAHLGEGVERSFEVLRELVRSTHVHDNRGDKDAHWFPYDGGIDWPKAMRSLRDAPHALPVLLEARHQDEFTRPMDKVIEVFAKLEAAWDTVAEATRSATAQTKAGNRDV